MRLQWCTKAPGQHLCLSVQDSYRNQSQILGPPILIFVHKWTTSMNFNRSLCCPSPWTLCVCIGTVLHVPQAGVPFSWPHVSLDPRSLKCICAHVPAAITHLNLSTQHLWSSSSPGQGQEVSWEKGRKQKQLLLAAGTDPEPWPLTSARIILAILTDKTQACKCSFKYLIFQRLEKV